MHLVEGALRIKTYKEVITKVVASFFVADFRAHMVDSGIFIVLKLSFQRLKRRDLKLESAQKFIGNGENHKPDKAATASQLRLE